MIKLLLKFVKLAIVRILSGILMSFLTHILRFLRVVFESARMTKVRGGVQSAGPKSRLIFGDVFSIVISLKSKNEFGKINLLLRILENSYRSPEEVGFLA